MQLSTYTHGGKGHYALTVVGLLKAEGNVLAT
jgi:hypothetical protein